MAKDSIGNSGRKMLADISNVPHKPSILNQDNKAWPSSVAVKEYIEQLQKENASLVKLLTDRNRVIELSGAEELNSRKDSLKDLQHQLGCKNALLIAKQKEMEGKRKMKTCETKEIKKLKVSDDKGKGVCVVVETENYQHYNTNGRQKSKSLVPSVGKVQELGFDDCRRLQPRRQSARFKHEEPKAKEEVFHTDNVDLPPCSLSDGRMQEDDLNSSTFSVKKEDVDNDSRPSISVSNKITQESRRLSISRSSREVAKKVQSYKEVGLVVT